MKTMECLFSRSLKSKGLSIAVLLIMNLFFVYHTALGQTSILATHVEKSLKIVLAGGRAQRRIVNENFIFVRWKKGKQGSEVHVRRYESEENAKKEFRLEIKLIDESLNGRGEKEPLLGVGEEGVIYSKLGRADEFGISFRRKEYCVEIDGLTLQKTRDLATMLDGHIVNKSQRQRIRQKKDSREDLVDVN